MIYIVIYDDEKHILFLDIQMEVVDYYERIENLETKLDDRFFKKQMQNGTGGRLNESACKCMSFR